MPIAKILPSGGCAHSAARFMLSIEHFHLVPRDRYEHRDLIYIHIDGMHLKSWHFNGGNQVTDK